MYGMGMPILFPLAAFNFMNQWICERMIVAWFMKLPPSLSDTLMQNFTKRVRFAPLLLVFNGWWMISNLQIFQNRWAWIDEKDQQMKSGHSFNYLANFHTLPPAGSNKRFTHEVHIRHDAPL